MTARMMTSYLTTAEVEALQTSGLNRETPYLIRGVSQTQLSVARFYGGAKYNGSSYLYLPESDELIRDDVQAWVVKRRKPVRKKSAK